MDYDFDACAGKWAERAFKLGYLEAWHSKVLSQGNIDWLDTDQIELLKSLESMDKDRVLTEVLGFAEKSKKVRVGRLSPWG